MSASCLFVKVTLGLGEVVLLSNFLNRFHINYAKIQIICHSRETFLLSILWIASLLFLLWVQKMVSGCSPNHSGLWASPVVMVSSGSLLMIKAFSNGFISMEEKVQLYDKSGLTYSYWKFWFLSSFIILPFYFCYVLAPRGNGEYLSSDMSDTGDLAVMSWQPQI